MRRTIKYHIWPRGMRFENGLQPLVEFVSKRKLVIGCNEVLCEFSISISAFEALEFDCLDEFIQAMKHTPVYEGFRCKLLFNRKGLDDYLKIIVSFNWRTVDMRVESGDADLVEAIHVFLKNTFNLRNPAISESSDDRAKYLQPTIFIAHSFDPIGEKYFTILSKFLRLLGLDVKHGLDFRSQDIPQKVRVLIDSQDILLAVISGNKEAPWLTAEPSYAMGHGKHIVLAVEKGVFYDPTILGKDLEQIRFEPGHIEQSFIPLLSEFRSIRVKGL